MQYEITAGRFKVEGSKPTDGRFKLMIRSERNVDRPWLTWDISAKEARDLIDTLTLALKKSKEIAP
jgi:hypothetical protein